MKYLFITPATQQLSQKNKLLSDTYCISDILNGSKNVKTNQKNTSLLEVQQLQTAEYGQSAY